MKIVRYPHPVLTYRSKPVKRIDQGLRDIAAEMLELINPVIQKRGGGMKDFEEGCLSFPDLHLSISRPDEITFQAIGLDGRPVTYSWKGFPARVVQHETDHLHGKCFYQRAKYSGELIARDALDVMAGEFEADRRRGFIPSDSEIAREIAELEKKYC